LTIGSDVQAHDPDLDDISALTHINDNIMISSGGAWVTVTPTTYYNILGLGTIATQDANSIAITGGTLDGASLGATSASSVRATTLVTTSGSIDTAGASPLTIGASVGANEITLGAATSTVVIPGDLEVQGATTTLNTATLDVEDANITANKGGTDGSAEGAGLTIERVGTDGSFVYEDALTTKWKLGSVGAESEVVDVDSPQTLQNKLIEGTRTHAETWTTSTTTLITHNFGTTDVQVEVYDIDSGATQLMDAITRNTNSVAITASTAPTGSGRRVLVKE
jgi:hypothetical protein